VHALSLVRQLGVLRMYVRMKLTIEGDGKGPVSRVHLPLVLPVTPPRPPPLLAHSLVYFIFYGFPGVCVVGGFRISQPSFSSGTW
jgi:hypothetical protein